jgi:ATP-binding cassette subfamily B protein
MNNVSFRYHSEETECLKNISLYIKHGTTTAIVGASGSGKTTLMKLLLGFYEPNIGIINIGEHDMSDISKDSWRKECGVVMQDGYIFSESVLQNIALGDNNPSLENAIYAAKIANVHNDIIKMPLEYNTIIGNDGKGLSLGQKQRILIARAIYKKPSYFFMDEATNSLDTTNERNIVEALSEHYNKATFVIIAHRLSTIRNADQIVVLENGQIVEIGNHNTLIKKRDRYYQLIKNQL